MNKVEKLIEIRNSKRQGDISAISELSGLNKGLVSNYIKNAHRMVMKPMHVDNIIKSYNQIR